MAINDFSKEERVSFEDIMEGFNDALVMSSNVNIYTADDTMMARTNDTIWRPQPYIAQSFDGTDQTANFQGMTQLSVPVTLGFEKCAPWEMTAKQLRDALQEKSLGKAAKQKLASDINVALMNVACNFGSLVIKRSSAAAGYDDAAQCDTIMNEQGVQMNERFMALCSRDYNLMAKDLAASTRSFGNAKSEKAYENSYVGRVANFDTFKLDYANRLAAAGGGGSITMDTRSSATSNNYVPVASRLAAGGTGERSNVDNRFHQITVSSTTSVAAGDCFTVATVDAVHHITKGDTGNLKTYRVVSVDSSTTMTITPPMITGQGGTDAELAYQNCVVNTPASNSALVFLNTVAAPINVFWHKDALELIPGRYAVDDSGIAVMRATTDQGIEVVFTKQTNINTLKTRYRLDTLFGAANKQPEMSGIMLFSQS